MKLAVTGANSSVGRNLLGCIAGRGNMSAVACVRTPRAAATLPASDNIQSALVSYRDVAGLAKVFEGANSIIHLAGVLFEDRTGTYHSANVETTVAVVEAARKARVGHVVFTSSLGADASSRNAYLRSKGEAEDAVKASGLPSTVIRAPLLLGPDSAAGAALVKAATRRTTMVLGGGRYTVRPLDIDDLNRAVLRVCRHPPEAVRTLELVGPEPVLYRDLLRRTAAMMDGEVRIVTVPVWGARLLAGGSYLVRRSGISPAIIDVITSDEVVSRNADKDLGITLTPLSATLKKLIEQS